VDDDGALQRIVVETFIQPLQAQRITVVAPIGAQRAVQAKAGFEAAEAIRKMLRKIAARVAAVRHQLAHQQTLVGQIENPQVPARGRQ
jgi:hypothetical protein